jgi:toxin ParE1/3/4
MQAGKRCLKGSALKTEMKAVFFHPEAQEEMINSAVFYETKSNGLGYKFLNEIARSLDLISVSPETWPVFSDDIRRFLLQRFPFGLLYEIHDDYLYIIAVMHLYREPFYWKNRLK